MCLEVRLEIWKIETDLDFKSWWFPFEMLVPLIRKLLYLRVQRLFNIQVFLCMNMVTHKGCDFNDDCTAFIWSFFNKINALQSFTDCISQLAILFRNVYEGIKNKIGKDRTLKLLDLRSFRVHIRQIIYVIK